MNRLARFAARGNLLERQPRCDQVAGTFLALWTEKNPLSRESASPRSEPANNASGRGRSPLVFVSVGFVLWSIPAAADTEPKRKPSLV